MDALIEQHRHEIEAVCRRHRIRSLALFGSAARGELRSDSDVDLLVEFGPDAVVGLLELQEVQAALSTVLGRSVDLAGPSILANPYRRRAILRDLQPIYGG